jgi:SynChlorMet cassette protein ScmC
MNPTLHDSEIMEIVPYNNRPLKTGDVIYFLSPTNDYPVVHRIIRITSAGISTLGDNNTQEDEFLLQLKNIKGQVVAAWRGQKRRKIAGGLRGWLKSRQLRLWRAFECRVFPLLHPLYKTLAHWGFIARLLPVSFQPQVVVFRTKSRDRYRLLLGRHIIGRYDDQKHQWRIQRPFRLFVEERVLQKKLDEDRTGLSYTQGLAQTIVLADESHWEIAAGNEDSASIVLQLGYIMQLSIMSPSALLSQKTIKSCQKETGNLIFQGVKRRLLVLIDSEDCDESSKKYSAPLSFGNDGFGVGVLHSYNNSGGLYIQLMQLSLIIARDVQTRGGVLIHAALAQHDGMGVILAGPGGVGKTTASNRLPPPWQSLCDDTTLVVRDRQGNYRAHPWPTWSRFLQGEFCGTWDVQNSVPIKGIFFLSQQAEDRVESIGSGQAVSLLIECTEQASQLMAQKLSMEETRSFRMECLNNLSDLVRVVPVYILHASLTGLFWKEIEKVL